MYLTLFLSPRGTLWECRYKAALLGSARYAFARYRYIKLNPVRAHGRFTDRFRWRSHAHNALGIQSARDHAPHRLPAARRHGDAALRTLPRAGRRAGSSGRNRRDSHVHHAYGSEKFRQQIEALTNRVVTVKPRGRPKLEPAAGK
jgi:putative transposase